MSTSAGARADDVRAGASPYTGWAGFNYDTGLPRERVKEVLLHCAANDIRAVCNTNISPGLLDLLYEEVDREIPLKGRRWVVGHVNVLSPRDIERIVRMGLVVTPHTNRVHLQGGSRHLAGEAAAGAPAREHAAARSARRRRQGRARHRQCAGLAVLAGLAIDRPPRPRHQCSAIAPEQALTRAEALRCATHNGAYLTFDEDKKGSLEPGKLADLAVLSADPLTVEEIDIRDISRA